MTSDPNSNLVSQLINRANSLEEQKEYRKTLYSIKSKMRRRSLPRKKEEDKCFPNTIGLVFSARKEYLISEIKLVEQKDCPEQFSEPRATQ
jgi:hypothetical protein